MAFTSSIRLAKLDDVETTVWTDNHFSNNTSFDWARWARWLRWILGTFDLITWFPWAYWTKDILVSFVCTKVSLRWGWHTQGQRNSIVTIEVPFAFFDSSNCRWNDMPLWSIPSFNMFLQACAGIEAAGRAMKPPHDSESTYHDRVELGWVQCIFINMKRDSRIAARPSIGGRARQASDGGGFLWSRSSSPGLPIRRWVKHWHVRRATTWFIEHSARTLNKHIPFLRNDDIREIVSGYGVYLIQTLWRDREIWHILSTKSTILYMGKSGTFTKTSALQSRPLKDYVSLQSAFVCK